MSNRRHKTTQTHTEPQARTRQQKQAEFQSTHGGPTEKKSYAVHLTVITLLGAVVVYLFLGSGNGEGALGRAVKVAATPGQDVRIPVAEVSDGQAKFYHYTLSNNQEIGFFVVKSPDGVIRAAFNACDVCYANRLGYTQRGNDMVCNKCGRPFPTASVNEVKGGCNPAPLTRTVEGDQLLIKASDLQQGAFYF